LCRFDSSGFFLEAGRMAGLRGNYHLYAAYHFPDREQIVARLTSERLRRFWTGVTKRMPEAGT
jgi:hypothetical protein